MPGRYNFLSGGGECGALLRALSWSEHPLGPPEGWPPSLKTIVGVILHSRHPMFLWWGDDLIQLYNDAYVPSFGAGKHPAAMGQRGAECWREIWPLIFPQIDNVMSRATASWNEDQLVPIHRNGRIEEVHWTYGYSPVYDEEGNVGGTLVVCTETTARVIAERRFELLRALANAQLGARDPEEAARLLAAVVSEASFDVPFALIYDGGPSPVSVRLDSDLVSVLDREIGGQRDRKGVRRLERPIAAGPWSEPVTDVFVVPMETVPGQAIVFGLSARLPFDDLYRRFLDQIVDQVTTTRARVRIERERRNLLEQAPVPTALMIGPDHVFEIANPLYREMVGRDVRGKAYLDAFPELRGTPLPSILDRVYRLGEPFVSEEMHVRLDRSGGLTDGFFKFNLVPIRDGEGQVYGMMAVANEITDQVRTRHALEAAARAKDEFLATMSHELRTPLNAILGWAKMLKGDHRDEAKLEKGLSVIERNAVSQARLVSDLLDVSRIVSGKLLLTLAPIDVAAAIHAAVDVVRAAADAKRVTLSLSLSPAIGTTAGDADRIQQIVWNLLTNAVRFTPSGGDVRISATRTTSVIRIEITDTGLGIPAEHLPFVFERFRQVDATSTRGHGGLGLGLAIVRSLVEAHGGTVSARSDGLGKGASFAITLPVRETVVPAHDDGPASLAIAPTVESAPLAGVRALVVDDDDDSLDLLREILERAGARVTAVNSAALALEANGPFDIIVSDIGMPKMDGFTLMQRIRARTEGADMPALALTAYVRREDAERALRAGYQEHLPKPLDANTLIAAVKKWATRALIAERK